MTDRLRGLDALAVFTRQSFVLTGTFPVGLAAEVAWPVSCIYLLRVLIFGIPLVFAGGRLNARVGAAIILIFLYSPATVHAAPWTWVLRLLAGKPLRGDKNNDKNASPSPSNSPGSNNGDTNHSNDGVESAVPRSVNNDLTSSRQLLDQLLARLGASQTNMELVGKCESMAGGQKKEEPSVLGLGKIGQNLGSDLSVDSRSPDPTAFLISEPESAAKSEPGQRWLTATRFKMEGEEKVQTWLRQTSTSSGELALDYIEKVTPEGARPTKRLCKFDRVKAGPQKVIPLSEYLSKGLKDSAYRLRRGKYISGGPPLAFELDSLMNENKIAPNTAAVFLNCRESISSNTSASPGSVGRTDYILFLFKDPASNQLGQSLVSIGKIATMGSLQAIRASAKAFVSGPHLYEGNLAPDDVTDIPSNLNPFVIQAKANRSKFYFRVGDKKNRALLDDTAVKRDPSTYCLVGKADPSKLAKVISATDRVARR